VWELKCKNIFLREIKHTFNSTYVFKFPTYLAIYGFEWEGTLYSLVVDPFAIT
jgi:hypothetical protein